MSASQSNLSASQYGYDVVVATTQASINTALTEFIAEIKQPVVMICYIANGTGGLEQIDHTTLVANAKGSDPFKVSDGADPVTDTDVQNLVAAGFITAFEAQIGWPPGVPIASIPIVTFNGGNSSVLFNLLCSQFTVVEYTSASGANAASWMNQSQQAGAPWMFTSTVTLNPATAAPANYSQLPAAVQAQITNLGSTAFSVQQLLFDLDNALLETVPVMSGITSDTNLGVCLKNDFLGAYFSTMQANGQPVLGVAIKQSAAANTASIALTNVEWQVDPLLVNGAPIENPSTAEQGLYTLNYLCAVNNNILPPPAAFSWNWFDDGETPDCDGVIAINGVTFSKWLANLFAPALSAACQVPVAECGNNTIGVTFTPGSGQQYTEVTGQPADPDGFIKILTCSYTSLKAYQDHWQDWHIVYFSIGCTYSLTSDIYVGSLSTNNNQIKVVTSPNAYVSVNVESGVTQGNFASYVSTYIFTISVNAGGNMLVSAGAPQIINNSQNPDVSIISRFFSAGTVDTPIDDIRKYVAEFVEDSIWNYDSQMQQGLSGPQSWVFPGGKNFAFKNVAFSNSQDLVAEISYTAP